MFSREPDDTSFRVYVPCDDSPAGFDQSLSSFFFLSLFNSIFSLAFMNVHSSTPQLLHKLGLTFVLNSKASQEILLPIGKRIFFFFFFFFFF